MKVLVTYASKHGSTAEIAEKISEILKKDSLDVDCKTVDEISAISIYDAVVLGSAVYIGQWRKNAVKFLKKFKNELSAKKIWLFSTGPTGEGDPEELMKGWKFPENLQNIADDIQPIDITIFHGALDESKLNTLEKITIKMVKAPIGDFRDWEAVERWSSEISGLLVSQK